MTKNKIGNLILVGLFILALTIGLTSCGPQEVASAVSENSEAAEKASLVDITMEGGTGKAYIKSPVEVTEKDGEMTAKLVWSSKNYDYMIVDGVRYENENTGGDSTFKVKIKNISEPLKVTADTVAMSVPHEIEYVITWGKAGTADEEITEGARTDREAVKKALEEAGLSLSEAYDLKYAKGFTIEKYGDYDYISIEGSGDYLIVPKNKDVPGGLPQDVTILKKPLDRTYLVSTSAMDLINTCGALNMIRLSGTKESDWYIDDAKEAMEKGDILYSGKYRSPDYELLLENGCNFAIESTMIYHEPAVKAKLEELGIPVLVERSSYEEHPLGRLEWIKLYGALFDKEAEAESYFEDQLKAIEPMLLEKEDTGKTVAFFYVTSNGLINVRKSGDYITKMIEIAGGDYVPQNAGETDNALSAMNMQMEDFYAQASQADIIIYNSTIGGEISSVDELTGKNPLFKDFKAVKDSNVYCTDRDLFQQITGMAEFIQDLNDIFTDESGEYTYIKKLK